jgi:hypothetical protein
VYDLSSSHPLHARFLSTLFLIVLFFIFYFSFVKKKRFCFKSIIFAHLSYAQQSLAVNDIFPRLDDEPISTVLIKISKMHEKNEDDDSCFTDDDELQFGEIEY